MTASVLSPLSMQTFLYENGAVVRPSRLFFYHPDTVDPLTVYTDHLLNVPHDVPVLSGGSGRVPPIYVGETPYRCRVYDSYGALIEDIPWLPGGVAPVEPGEPGDPAAETLQTGDYVLTFNRGAVRAGLVRANGGLIGPPGFSGSGYQIERLNADTHDLFVHLWGQDIDVLDVVPAFVPGESAEDAWLANKALSLPDLRGSALACIDGMGTATSGVLDGVTFGRGTGISPGGWGGAAFTTQGIGEMPQHSHLLFTYQGPGNFNASGYPAGQAAGASPGYTMHTTTSVNNSFAIGPEGGGVPMQTIGPFGLVAVYIKL